MRVPELISRFWANISVWLNSAGDYRLRAKGPAGYPEDHAANPSAGCLLNGVLAMAGPRKEISPRRLHKLNRTEERQMRIHAMICAAVVGMGLTAIGQEDVSPPKQELLPTKVR